MRKWRVNEGKTNLEMLVLWEKNSKGPVGQGVEEEGGQQHDPENVFFPGG